ncbi:hypothetical protein NKH77_32450 [Streptomyces sp. M19]
MQNTSRAQGTPTLTTATRQAARVALRWISEPDRTEELTHAELLDQAARAAKVLGRLGYGPGTGWRCICRWFPSR